MLGADWIPPGYLNGDIMDKIIASEALYGFGGWLTSRNEQVTFSAIDDAAPMAELVKEFCEANDLAEPRKDWEINLIHPKS